MLERPDLPICIRRSRKIGHADRPMQEWVAAWEAVFNLGAGELSFDGRTRGVINITSSL